MRSRRRSRWAALAVAAGFLLSACGGSDSATDSAVGSAESATGPVLDASVLSGAATTVTGESFDLGSLAGQDLIVWFWAPW